MIRFYQPNRRAMDVLTASTWFIWAESQQLSPPPVQVCPPVTSTLWTRWSQTNCQQPLWPPKIILTKKLDAWFQFRAAAECFEVERDKRRNTLCMSRTTFGKSTSSSINSHPFKVLGWYNLEWFKSFNEYAFCTSFLSNTVWIVLLGASTAPCITFTSGGRGSAYRLGIMQDITAQTPTM